MKFFGHATLGIIPLSTTTTDGDNNKNWRYLKNLLLGWPVKAHLWRFAGKSLIQNVNSNSGRRVVGRLHTFRVILYRKNSPSLTIFMSVRCPTESSTFRGHRRRRHGSDVLDPPLSASFAYAPLRCSELLFLFHLRLLAGRRRRWRKIIRVWRMI